MTNLAEKKMSCLPNLDFAMPLYTAVGIVELQAEAGPGWDVEISILQLQGLFEQ